MARGSIAKTEVVQKIIAAFGDDYVGEASNKYYVWADDGGEKVQIAITLTCPKNPLETSQNFRITDGGIDFTQSIKKPEVADFTEDEKSTINKLMAELGL